MLDRDAQHGLKSALISSVKGAAGEAAPLQPLVEIFRQPNGAGEALPQRPKTHPASVFEGPRLVHRPLGIIHITDVYVVFGARRCKTLDEPRPSYLGARDEKSGLDHWEN